RARGFLLNPQRRLQATGLLCDTHLRAARAHQVEAERLAEAAHQSDPPDERRLLLAGENRQRSIDYVQQGLRELGELLKKSPSAWNSGLWEEGFYMILANFDRADGNSAGVEANTAAASAALERELRRRPFEPELALTYVSVSGGRLDVGALFEVLARPLRHARTPPAYLEYVRRISQTTGFDQAFQVIRQTALAAIPEQPVAGWENPWAPETLRLAAIIWATRGDYATAEQDVTRAAGLYDVLPASAPIGLAACYEELAECRFYAYPDAPEKAIEEARNAIKFAPDSETGRGLVRAVRSRMATYSLAAGDEVSARALLRELEPDVDDAVIDTELGYRHSRLAHTMVRHDAPSLPGRLAFWVERALQLNPQYEAGWEENEEIQLLRRALEAGADRGVITAFVDQVLLERPTSGPFTQLRDELRGTATQPTTTGPAARQPANTKPETYRAPAGAKPSE
ncbi:MAG: hypothetical protein ACYSUQ_03090, partial [Planctomycetota bacterium]